MGTARQEIPRIPDHDRDVIRILHLRASNFYGGPERQLHMHARLAGGSRYHIAVSSFAESGQTPEFLQLIANDGIATHTFPVASAYDYRAVSLVREYLSAQRIDILCTHDYRSHLIGYLARQRLSVKWIAFSRGFTWDNLKIRTFHWVEKMLARFADRIVAVSHAQSAKLKRLYVPERKVSVIHNAIDLASLQRTEPQDLRVRFGLPAEAIVAVAAGRFSREKGQPTLVQAGSLAVMKNPRLRIVMFGNGPELDRIKQSVRDLGCDQYIICPGFERNILACVKGADMLVNPSFTEGLPNVLLEAMALGIPVIATNVGGVPELVTHAVSGLLVQPDDAYALAEGMLTLANDPQRRAALAVAALETVRQSFSFEGQFAKLATVYDEVIIR